ncbi:MAG: BON domain-containing protein [Symploca sp. SIO2G7]|nr:BON domain-containing protein [Symploca sp. SIO2G7]
MESPAITFSLKNTSQPCQVLADRTSHYHWISTIPPERRGLHGEFDYCGLSKRVCRCLHRNVTVAPGYLKVRQRGRVVVLLGRVSSLHLLHQIVDLALSVDGVDDVETYGVAIAEAC